MLEKRVGSELYFTLGKLLVPRLLTSLIARTQGTPAKQALAARLMRLCHLEPRTDHQPGFILPVTGQLYQVISNSSRRWR